MRVASVGTREKKEKCDTRKKNRVAERDRERRQKWKEMREERS